MFSVGSVVLLNGTKYRILQAQGTVLILIGLEVEKYIFFRIDVSVLKSLPGVKEVEDPYKPQNTLVSDEELAIIKEKQAVIRQMIIGLGENIDFLQGNRTCSGVSEYMERFGLTRKYAHRDIRRYLQSGMDMYSLRDGRKSRVVPNEGMFSGRHKGGHSFADGSTRVRIDPALEEEYFREGFRMIDRERSLAGIVDMLNIKYFSEVVLDEDGNLVDIIPAPINECLSEKRFRKYCFERINGMSLTKYRKGARERMNEDRIKRGTAQTGCTHPGAIVEIDACELDIIIVGKDRRKDLGRPVVYFAVDVFSCRIIGHYVGFENNSFLGATSLFASMFFSGDRILPDAIRVDHGSEWVSKSLTRIGKELGIDIEIVPPAAGSFKGLVENAFHVYQKRLRDVGREYGAIYKEYGSKHYDKASAMLQEIDQDIKVFIETFNRTLRKGYELSKHMVMCGVKAVPDELWKYGVENLAVPRRVTDAVKMKVLFSLCEPVPERTYSLSRSGFSINGLCYISEDPRIRHLINLEKREGYEVRKDPRTVDHIWVRIGEEVVQVPIGEFHDNLVTFAGLTWREYEMLCQDIKSSEQAYELENRRQRYIARKSTERTLKNSKKGQKALGAGKNVKKGIRDARMEAQQDDRYDHALGKGITDALPGPELPELPGPADIEDICVNKGLRLEDLYE